MKIRCYVAEGETTLFHMATWEMAGHLVSGEKLRPGDSYPLDRTGRFFEI